MKLERQMVMSLSAVILPGERKNISVESSTLFKLDQLVISEVARSKIQLIIAYLHVFHLMILENFFSLFSEHAAPGWKLMAYYPMRVIQLQVGMNNQFLEGVDFPAQLFGPLLNPRLHWFGTCQAGQKITLTIQSEAKHPFNFRAALIGWAIT